MIKLNDHKNRETAEIGFSELTCQAWQLQEVLSSMAVAVNNQNQQLTSEVTGDKGWMGGRFCWWC